MNRPALALLALVALVADGAHARVGFGDPAAVFRERDPEQPLVLDGHFRLRSALFSNLDLDRGASPTTGTPLWPQGETPLDLTAGQDMRLRVAPSWFIGDEVRLFAEVSLLENVALGARPRGTPFDGRPAIVLATAFLEPLSFAEGAFQIRQAGAEVLTPFGVLSVGRMTSHFGLGITTNAGDDLNDDGGDLSDRIAFVTPLFGHYFALAYDWAAAGGSPLSSFGTPDPVWLSDQVQSVSAAVLRFHAPWEVRLHQEAMRPLFDYGVAASAQWQRTDVPGVYQGVADALGISDATRVRRDGYGLVVDAWARFVFGPLRVEAEAVASHLYIDNPSPWAGVEVRQPVTGNPFGGVLVVDYTPFGVSETGAPLSVMGEAGVASSDPGFGFPLAEPSAFVGARPGDVKGPQLDGPRDARMDAFRFHPTYRVDLILWRTLLGGVSEAAYGRAKVSGRPVPDVLLELNAVYSHGLHPESTPGGVGPLGVEVDAAAQLSIGAFSLRADYGVLFPLGGLGARGGSAPGIAQMLLLRLGYDA